VHEEILYMDAAIVTIALIGYIAFRQWLVHHRRIMIHRERLTAIEKGIALPPLEREVEPFRQSSRKRFRAECSGSVWLQWPSVSLI
jgi:hypothetical protein